VLDVFTSFYPIMMAYIGGIGSFFGPIIGSAVLHLLEDLTFRFTERVDLVNGLVFITVVLFAPMGLVGILRAVKERWFTKKTTARTIVEEAS
jgi:branched-chain amino acid transport system permease protein